MDLKSFLKWEEPVFVKGYTQHPQVYIAQKSMKSKNHGTRLVFNHPWCIQNLPNNIDKKLDAKKLFVAISIDREKKIVYAVFDPPTNIPQYPVRAVYKKSFSIQLTNKMLLDDVWELMNMPAFVGRQVFDVEMHQEVEGRKVFRLTYNPKKEENMNIMANAKKSR